MLYTVHRSGIDTTKDALRGSPMSDTISPISTLNSQRTLPVPPPPTLCVPSNDL